MRSKTGDIVIAFIVYVVFQLLVLYRFVLMDVAFAFFYVGFLLLLPSNQNVLLSMTIGFFTGLLIDFFSNTPGVHASASVALCFLRLRWLNTVIGGRDELQRISIHDLGISRFSLYLIPLVLLHHALIFILENGSLSPFFTLAKRFFWSTLLSAFLILMSNYLLTNKRRRI